MIVLSSVWLPLNPTCSIISYGDIFNLVHFDLRPLFQEHNYGVKRGLRGTGPIDSVSVY
jgi:hypothetical protein